MNHRGGNNTNRAVMRAIGRRKNRRVHRALYREWIEDINDHIDAIINPPPLKEKKRCGKFSPSVR
jgi:hypothetical protein